jgi:hypothetical protein
MSSEETVTGKIKELKPEILKYLHEITYDFHLSWIKDIEEEYKKEAEKCGSEVIVKESELASRITDLIETISEECVNRYILKGERLTPDERAKGFVECSKLTEKLGDLIKWSARRATEDLKKCGCQFK